MFLFSSVSRFGFCRNFDGGVQVLLTQVFSVMSIEEDFSERPGNKHLLDEYATVLNKKWDVIK